MSKNTNISELINYLSYDGSGNIVFNTVSSATTNTDKFLVSDAGTLKFRTAAQLLSDIGAQASGSYQAALSGTGFVKISGSTISYDNSTYATQTYVGTAISNLVASSPATLDTLNELALALGSDPNFATTVATSIGTKQAQLNGTGFVKISGTTISYDNSTYLTSASLTSYVPYTGATGAVNLGNYNLTIKEIVIGTGAKNNTNIAIGRNVMSYSSGGTGNVAIGVDALYFDQSNGSVVIGYEAGYYSNQGRNVTIGYQAGRGNGPGSNSIAVGYQALLANTNGSSNIAIGYLAGSELVGSNNTIIGGYLGTTMSSNVVIADGAGNIRFQWDGSNIKLNGNTVGSNAYTSTAYLPLAGGTLTGNLLLTSTFTDFQNTSYIRFSNTGGATRWGYLQHNGTDLAFSNDISGGKFTFDKLATFSTGLTIGTQTQVEPLTVSYAAHGLISQHRQSNSVGVGQNFYMKFNNAAGNAVNYAGVYADIQDNTTGAHSGRMILQVANAGSLLSAVTITNNGATTFSSSVSATGFYSTTGSNFATSSGRVGVGTSTPADKFVVSNSGAEGIEFGFDTGIPYLFGYNRSTSAYKPIAFVGSGNVIITQGTITDNGSKLQVTGAATFSSSITANTYVEIVGDLRFNSSAADRSIYFRGSTASPDGNWKMGNYLTPTGATVVTAAATVIDVYNGAGYGFMVRNTSNSPLLQIAGNTGAATFSSDIQGGGDLYFNKATRTTIYPTTTNQNLHMKSNGSGVLQFNDDNAGNLTMCVGGGSVLVNTSTKWGTEKFGVQMSQSASWTATNAIMRLTNYVSGGKTKIIFTDSNIIDGWFGMVPVANASYFVMGFSGYTEEGFRLYQNGTSNFANTVTVTGNVMPSADATYNLGSTSLRWNNVYTTDLHLSNEGKQNVVDGTWGDWTLQEGENDIFMLNNRSGEKFKIKLEKI